MKRYVPKASQARSFRYGHPYGWFYCELYGENIHLLWNVTTEQLQKFLKRKFKCNEKITLQEGKTLEMKGVNSRCQVIVLRYWRGESVSHNILAHEAFHCAEHILGAAGIKLTEDTVEAYAYMVGYIVDQCVQIITGRAR